MKILFYEENVVYRPSSLYIDMLTQIHDNAHFDIVKCKKRTRQLVYWPKMNEIYKNMQSMRSLPKINNTKEPMISHELPKPPFEKISIEIAEYGNKSYLIVKKFLSKCRHS